MVTGVRLAIGLLLTVAAPGWGQALFTDVTREAGLGAWVQQGGGEAARWSILGSTGSGACFLDGDLDGDLDLYLVNGGSLEKMGAAADARDAYFRNEGGWRFVDATAEAGLAENAWGGGCAAGDVDNDGDADLFVSNFGRDVLLINEGGRFRDAGREAGLPEDREWGLGATFFDADRDGWLDLFVANYLRHDPVDPATLAQRCRWKGGEVMCGPRGFPGEGDFAWRNLGGGRFADAREGWGVGQDVFYGMGVVAGDPDLDGDLDLFVANDSQENQLWVNDGQGRFTDQALEAGVALAGDGRAQAGMGADFGDADGDLDLDLVVSNFSDDYHTLYRNEGGLTFSDITAAAGLDGATRFSVGWGGGFFDVDNDGDLDLLLASGHVYHGVEAFDPLTSYRQRQLLFENDGRGRFREIGPSAGTVFAEPSAGRGVAFGDLDDDGDLDVLIVQQDAPPTLLRNDAPARHSLQVKLVGRLSNRDGLGARLVVEAGGRRLLREARRSAGYLASHDPRVHFGLGDAKRVDRLTITWPSGREQVLRDLPADHQIEVDEERGLIASIPRRAPLAPVSVVAPAASPASPAPSPVVAPAVEARTFADAAIADFYLRARAATGDLQAGRLERGIAGLRSLLAELPAPGPATDALQGLGFGDADRFRGFVAALHDNLGVGLMRAEHFDECAAAHQQASAIVAKRQFLHNLGVCHLNARRYAEALDALRAAAAPPEPAPGVQYDLGRALAAAQQCAEAEVALAAALKELPDPDPQGRAAEAWYALGSCRLVDGHYTEAVAALRETLERVPGHQRALYKLAQARTRAGDANGAAYALGLFRARQAEDEKLQALERAGARGFDERLALARARLKVGLTPQAMQVVRTALADRGSDPQAWALLGETALSVAPPDLELATRAFRRALDTAPELALARLGFAFTAARTRLQDGDHIGAVALLRPLAAQYPRDPLIALALAEALLGLADDPETARVHAAEALDLLEATGYYDAPSDRARILALRRLGRLDEAAKKLAESPFLGQRSRDGLD